MPLPSIFLPRAALLAAALLPLSVRGAPHDSLPPPGLYQVSTDATIKVGEQQVRMSPQAGGNATLLEGKRAGKAPEQRSIPGPAGGTVCMAARQPNAAFVPPTGSCSGPPGVSGPDGTTFQLSCGGMDMTTLIRKIDSKNWEYRVTTVEYQGGAGSAGGVDFTTQKAIMKLQAKTGATPEDRAEAVKALADWPAYEAEVRAMLDHSDDEDGAPPKKAATPATRKVLRKSTSVTRLTRVADTCKPATDALPAPR